MESTPMEPGRYTVLLYHGVHADDVDLGRRNSSGKHVPASRFDDEMARLAASNPVVTMRDIAAAHRGDITLPPGAVAVTFDDGFANNHRVAWPILERHGVAATFYLATGYIGTGRMMWSDRLEATFLGTAADGVTADIRGERLSWPTTTEDERIAGFTAMKARCKELPYDELQAVVEATVDHAAVAAVEDHPLYAFMSWDDAREMAASPLVDLGAHTVDHVSLARATDASIAEQIDRSLAEVTDRIGGGPCELFAYPEGQEGDVDERVIAHLVDIGIDHAPMAVPGDNHIETTSPYRIRRTMVGFEGRPYPL
jgi:peptidoglycan/xylan/chitin deacetylase (PgdA/CDA1 family)